MADINLAHPLFMAGYIEHLGTGTTDMIADCEALGLRTPEFIQADDFRTIIYRQEKVTERPQKVSDPTEKVTELDEKVTERPQKVTELDEKSNQADPKSNQAEPQSNQVRLTAKQRKVLDFYDETPRTAQEILEMLGVQNQNKTRQQYTTKLVLAGLLRPTTTHKNDSNRRYITAHPSTER
ncbi:MAG: hypothetical protein IJ249_01505 [Paludibacteraceae bacterium]|nr:hypothetical protein [Paludibacteraceae bacterium]